MISKIKIVKKIISRALIFFFLFMCLQLYVLGKTKNTHFYVNKIVILSYIVQKL